MKKFFLVLTFILFAGFTFAGTTGSIVGKVTDSTGAPLPGVTVVATSPSLQGQKTTTTNADGKYRLVLLPPGVYTLKYSLAGFQATVKKNVKVNLDIVTTVNVTLKEEGVSEQIEVVAEKPLIDVTTTTTGANYSTDYVEQMPTARSYLSVVQLTPGVTGTDISGGMIVNGASGTESNYIIDGLNTTDLENGTQGKGLNFDFVEEVQIKTGGFEPEFGRSTGAVVNVITKSGGNEFHGTVFYYWRTPSYSAKSPAPWYGSSYVGTKEHDYGFSLGGYIIKDKLWFFLAYNPATLKRYYNVAVYSYPTLPDGTADHDSPKYYDEDMTLFKRAFVGRSLVERKTEYDNWALKLTYNINENHTVVFSAFGDPHDYYFQSTNAPDTADTKTSLGGTDWTVKYDGILSENFVVSAQVGYHYQERKDHSLTGNDDLSYLIDYEDQYFREDGQEYVFRNGGPGYMENTEMERYEYKASLEWFLDTHDIKFGIDYEDNKFDSGRKYSGGAYYAYFFNLGNDYIYFYRRMFARLDDQNGEIFDVRKPYTPVDGHRYHQLHDFLQTKTKTEYTAVFIQDKWQVTDNFMLSYGFRWEDQKIKGNHSYFGGDYTALEIDDAFAPRIGFTWDIFGDGTSKLYAHWGRFYEYIPMDINNRSFAEEILVRDYWIKPLTDKNGDGVANFFDFDPQHDYTYDYTQEIPYKNTASGIYPSPVADDLNGQSVDEFIIGYDYMINDLWSIGIKFTWRELNDIIEDVSFDGGGQYIIANPGRDLTFTWNYDYDYEFYDNLGNYHIVHPGETITLTAEETGFSKPKRNYRAYELKLKRKFADGWTVDLSIIRSDLWGDYIGGVLPFYGQTDPNLTAAYDLPSTLVNTNGPLPFDRPWQVKANGLYQFDWGLNVGFQYTYMSGTPIAAYGNPDPANLGWPTGWYGEFRLIKNGAPGLGRTDAIQSLDLNLSYTYDIGKYGSLTGYFYIFNVFNWQNVMSVNQNFTEDGPSQAWLDAHNMTFEQWAQWIDGRFNTLGELKEFAKEAGMHINGNFGRPEAFQTPRYIRFGIKYKF